MEEAPESLTIICIASQSRRAEMRASALTRLGLTNWP
jgi:hypothetical protein